MSRHYGRHSAELDWLREVMALPTSPRLGDEKIDKDRNVQTFVDGPYWLARGGTPEGFRRMVWLTTGVEVVVDEPGQTAWPGVLALPDLADSRREGPSQTPGVEENILGFSTLPDPDNPQARLPGDLAHHFVVRGYEADLSDRNVREIVERAVALYAPAHTTYTVQVIEARARVGVQCRLGIDAVIAPSEPADPFALDLPPGPDAQLDPTPLPPTLGSAHLGHHTPLI